MQEDIIRTRKACTSCDKNTPPNLTHQSQITQRTFPNAFHPMQPTLLVKHSSINPVHPFNLNHPTQLTQPNPTYTPHIPNPAHQTPSPILPNSTQPIQLTQPNPQSPTCQNQLNQLNPPY